MVERIRHLLTSRLRIGPENILVLDLQRAGGRTSSSSELSEQVLGLNTASRLWVHNFHSFGNRILSGTRHRPGSHRCSEVLDGVGQRLLLRELRPPLRHFLYHPMARAERCTDASPT